MSPSAVEVGKHRPASAGRPAVLDVPRARHQRRRTHRQRTCRHTLDPHHQEHPQSAQDRGQDGQDRRLFMVALCNRQTIYIFMLFLSSSFFSSPNLSGRRVDVYDTLAHGVALVRI